MPSYDNNPLDQEVNTELMRVCKCVVPYLDAPIQKNIAIGLKFLELVNTMNVYANPSKLSTPLSMYRQGNWEEDLLRSVRASLSPEKAYLIDAMIKLREFKTILNVKNDTPTPSEDDLLPSFFEGPSDFQRDTSTSTNTENQGPSKASNNGPSPASLLQALSPLLDDNQKQLLNVLSGLMNTK